MTERLADISARIDGVRQLGAVVNAMKGIAAARARVARSQVEAVDGYAATIAAAMASVLAPGAAPAAGNAARPPALLVFCAEQGFAGAFSERVLDSLAQGRDAAALFLVGTRGLSIARSRGIAPAWAAAMPSHTPGVPKLADAITTAVLARLGAGDIDGLDVVFAQWRSGRAAVVRQALLPLDLRADASVDGNRPPMQLPADRLTESLGADYLHAQICKAALHAFAAENEARMAAMAAAGEQIASELDRFEATLRRVRQEAITAEIIELGAGAPNLSVTH